MKQVAEGTSLSYSSFQATKGLGEFGQVDDLMATWQLPQIHGLQHRPQNTIE